MTPPSRVLITGATGNIGSEVLRLLSLSNIPSLAAHQRLPPPPLPSSTPASSLSTPVHLDFADPSTFAPALRGCDALFLLRPPPISDMEHTLNALIREARSQSIRHIVFISVMGAADKQWVPHAKVERCLRERDHDWTILRPGFFAQNIADAYRLDITQDRRLYVPAAQGRVSFIDARDIAAAAVATLSDPLPHLSQTYTLPGPSPLSFSDVASLLSDALLTPIHYVPASIPGYLWHLSRRRHLPLFQSIIQTILHVGLRSGEASSVTDALPSLLGHPPRSLASYIADHLSRWQTPTS
jgi:uncharacterized protein YbjT (DUF2867 family)